MKRGFCGILMLTALLAVACACSAPAPDSRSKSPGVASAPLPTLKLPAPGLQSGVSLEEAFLKRRSIREYANLPLTIEEGSQLLWAAQGITGKEGGGRTAPSAGALYPLEVYLVVGNIRNLAPGVYRYRPENHELVMVRGGDLRAELAMAASEQVCVKEGAIDIVFTAVYERTTRKYGERGIRYVHIEAGHSAQNVCLQATALNLGAVTVGAFSDEQVRSILDIPQVEVPLYIIPVGRKKT